MVYLDQEQWDKMLEHELSKKVIVTYNQSARLTTMRVVHRFCNIYNLKIINYSDTSEYIIVLDSSEKPIGEIIPWASKETM